MEQSQELRNRPHKHSQLTFEQTHRSKDILFNKCWTSTYKKKKKKGKNIEMTLHPSQKQTQNGSQT